MLNSRTYSGLGSVTFKVLELSTHHSGAAPVLKLQVQKLEFAPVANLVQKQNFSGLAPTL